LLKSVSSLEEISSGLFLACEPVVTAPLLIESPH